MLASLAIRDIVLIERAALEFGPGLNVLTGETGAGKTILLEALGLAVGGRSGARAGLRPGAGQGGATAVFDVPADDPVRAMLSRCGVDGARELVLRRTISADGRTRAFINDEPVGVALAREVGASLLEVHGQADDRGLFDTATHRALLDTFGGHLALARESARAFEVFADARHCLGQMQSAAAAAEGELENVTYALRELSQLAPEVGEEKRLAEERVLLLNAGRIAGDVAATADHASGERGAETALAQALRRLSRMAPEGREAARAAETALESALAHVQESRRELESLLSRLDADPAKLEKLEDRLFALRDAARKYRVPCDRLPELRKEFEARLAEIDGGGSRVAAAEQECARAQDAFLSLARRLSAARNSTARKLEAAVARELAPLKMAHARFRVSLAPLAEDDANANGLERIVFEVTTVEGASFGPLAKIASGGELARFALALKVVLAEASPPAVLVFDEVDRGVGGAVADAVGERLQRLARTAQVLLVTHSPQVAARAAHHFRITRKGDTVAVQLLADDARAEEIARMLSGAAITGEARAAARRLIAEAQGEAAPVPKKRARA
ncbi:MAG: DNA repair protein RecN [Alphaproteobacteria bacterium]